MRYCIIFLLIVIPLIAGESEKCEIVSHQGNVEIRSAYEEAWVSIQPGQALEPLTTMRTGRASAAVLRTFNGTSFRLPAESQIEIRELMKLTRDEIIMELTAYELQKLPSPTNREKPAQAFVLHGSAQEMDDKEAQNRYITLEINGALALYNQGFMAGFILKWNRLHYQFPDVRMPAIDARIETAYGNMEMPGRLKAARQQ